MTSDRQRQLDRALEQRIGYRFRDPALLERALTHASALSPSSSSSHSYQRLEFLGDRVLGLAIATMLDKDFPEADEGELARRLNRLVRRETCAEVANELDIGPALRIGDGEAQSGGRKKTAILADVCEALIAAIYLDGGIEPAMAFVDRFWRPHCHKQTGPLRDAKTTLQEWAQGKGLPAPTYEITQRGGPDHAPTFTVTVAIKGLQPGKGVGGSRRIAEQNAAETVLRREGIWTEEVGRD